MSMTDTAPVSSDYALPPQDDQLGAPARPAVHRRLEPSRYAWLLIMLALAGLWMLAGVGFRGRLG